MSDLFKAQLANDLTNVFLNPDEFAEPHNINGIDGINCVIDSDTTQSLRPGLGRFDGTEKETMMLFVAEADWSGNGSPVADWQSKPPAYRQQITVDFIRWIIKNADIFNGLYELTLEAVK